VLQYQVKLALF